MPTYTATVSQCPAGGHVTISVKRDGVAFRNVLYNRDDMFDAGRLEFDDILYVLVRQAIKAAGATTPLQVKNAIEAASWSI